MDCFYCGLPMEITGITKEHLVNIVDGGSNKLSNLVLAHFTCNQLAGNKTLVEKIQLRDCLRKQGVENE